MYFTMYSCTYSTSTVSSYQYNNIHRESAKIYVVLYVMDMQGESGYPSSNNKLFQSSLEYVY
jgi:hypothetical protein